MNLNHIYLSCFLMGALVFAPTSTQAQTLIDPSRTAQDTSTSLSNDDESSVGGSTVAEESTGDSDLGIQVLLKRNENAHPFSVWVDSSGFWTDNAANVSTGETQDYFYAGGVNAAWRYKLGDRYYADAYLGQHWYRYDSMRQLDYDNGEVSFGLLAALPELKDSIFHLHYYYQRITQDITDSSIYDAHQIRVGLQKAIQINAANSLNIGLTSSYGVGTSPELLQRHEHALQLGYKYKVSSQVVLSLSYRLAYFDYFNMQGREDVYQNLGAAVTYRPCVNFEMSAGYYYAINQSSNAFFDYQTQLGGISVAAKLKF